MKAVIKCSACQTIFEVVMTSRISRFVDALYIEHDKKKSSCNSILSDFVIDRFEPCRCAIGDGVIRKDQITIPTVAKSSKGLQVEFHHGVHTVTGDHISVERWVEGKIKEIEVEGDSFNLSVVAGDSFYKTVRFERRHI